MRPIQPARPIAPAKARILEVASRLFYTEGIHAVGVDRIIERSQVTKATFYKHYRSKDLLIIAYIGVSHDYTARLAETLREAHPHDPVGLLESIVAAIAHAATDPRFAGDPFINTAAQFPDPSHPVAIAVSEHRRWERALLVDALGSAGYPDPEHGADDVLLLRDGTLSNSSLGDPKRASAALHRATARIVAECRTAV